MNLKPKIFDKKLKSHRVNHEEEDAAKKISEHLLELLPKHNIKPFVIVCVGSDRSTGDALGPLIGSKLQEKAPSLFHVYGTLDEPIHAVNLEEKLSYINEAHKDPFIIGIDACLGRLKSVGAVTISEGPLKPGAGVNKELPSVGELHITGIVNVSGFMEYMVLQNTRLSLVMKIADAITEGIYKTSLARERKNQLQKQNFNWKLSN